MGGRGRGSRVAVIGGWVVDIIVVGGAAGGLRRSSTGKVSRITKEKGLTPSDL